MDEQNINELAIGTEEQVYKPRPKYQVWAARIGVVIVAVAFLLYCWQIGFGAP